jgi:RNA polymerase sigma-70 factor (ECF subfamily)
MEHMLNRARKQDQEAITTLVRLYSPILKRRARLKLDRQLQGKVDADDVIQDLWRSFFCRNCLQQEFADPKQFVSFLLSMVDHKAQDTNRLYQTQRRCLGKEQRIEELPPGADFREKEAGPVAKALEEEQWQRLLAAQPENIQNVLLRLRGGESVSEIAGNLGVPTRTLKVILQRVLLRLSA